MQMIAGLADIDIQRKVLGQEDKTLEATEKFIIAEESGKWSTLEIGSELQMAAGLSNYKKQQGHKRRRKRIVLNVEIHRMVRMEFALLPRRNVGNVTG